MEHLNLDQITMKLFVLKNYDRVFMGDGARQILPQCCGKELDLGTLLRTQVQPLTVPVDGETILMFSATCPACGRVIPPQWRNASGRVLGG